MDPAIAPLILFALVAAMAGTWIELKSSLQPAICPECPHCRDVVAAVSRAGGFGVLGAVAFVETSHVPKGLKVLKIDGVLPGDKGYALR